jgi:phenylacetate-CoA ligase
MPFIRYRTMDICVTGAQGCDRCNRKYQLIDTIDGRLNEFLITEDKTMFYTSLSGISPDVFKNVKQFQFYQDEPGIAYLKIVKSNTYTDSDTLLIKKEIDKRFHIPESGLRINIIFVDTIEKPLSGKTLMTVQRLDIKDFIKL